jgi:tetratricopeptide (TPR) repeat protein
MNTEKGFFNQTMDNLYESAKSQKPGSTFKSRVQRPRKLYKEMMDGWRRRAENPEERATLRELAALFGNLWYQHQQALEASDFDKALQIFDKLIEVDTREIFIGIPFLSIPQYRQKLVNMRDYMDSLQKANQATKENRQADAIKILEFLIQEYSNQSPGLPDSLLQIARENLQGQLWTQGFNQWWTAFIAEDLPQALEAISYLRQVETSISSSSPMTAIVKNVFFPAHEYTHWNYMRTLHRHFHANPHPSLALKVVSYILKLYDFPGNVELLPWLDLEDLRKERDFERLYEALIRRNKFFAGS